MDCRSWRGRHGLSPARRGRRQDSYNPSLFNTRTPQIYADIDRLAPVKLETLTWRPRLPLYQWPLGGAVILGLALWCLLLTGSIFFRWKASSHA